MTSRNLAALLFSGTFVLGAGMAWPASLNVNLVLGDDSAPYRQFAEALNKALDANTGVAIVETRDLGSPRADLVVAVGMKALELAAAQSITPVLAVMVPETGYQDLLASPSRPISAKSISAIYISQPWERQFDFLQAALPGRRKIGLLYSPDARLDVQALSQLAAKRGRSLVARPVPSAEGLFFSLEDVLAHGDLLLATPDSAIYSGSTIRNILLSSYRRGVPLVGLSQAYVNAGALCAVFSTSEQIAGQTAATVSLYARTRRLPDPQFPEDFTVGVNRQVARSLGIEVPSEDAIYERMGKLRGADAGSREQ